METDYFLNRVHDAPGYWGPPTSSIDFCESNYQRFDLIAEPHNVWSSLVGLSLVAVLGIAYGNPTRERRFALIYSILFVIGIGSACLHATLHWCFQSSDELPMIYLVIAGFYIVLEVDSPRGTSKYPEIPKYLILLGCINTAVYFSFQQLYLVFLATFTGLIIGIMCFHIQLAWRLYQANNRSEEGNRKTNNTLALRFYKWHYIGFIVFAVPIWTLDQFYCEHFLPLYNNLPLPFRGMTLHVAWHICAGISAHFFVQFLCACRANTLGMVSDMAYVLWVFPVVVFSQKKSERLKA